jgi:hypothetical protein
MSAQGKATTESRVVITPAWDAQKRVTIIEIHGLSEGDNVTVSAVGAAKECSVFVGKDKRLFVFNEDDVVSFGPRP